MESLSREQRIRMHAGLARMKPIGALAAKARMMKAKAVVPPYATRAAMATKLRGLQHPPMKSWDEAVAAAQRARAAWSKPF